MSFLSFSIRSRMLSFMRPADARKVPLVKEDETLAITSPRPELSSNLKHLFRLFREIFTMENFPLQSAQTEIYKNSDRTLRGKEIRT